MMQEINNGQDPTEALKKEVSHLLSVVKRALKRVRWKLSKQEEEYSEAKQFPHFTQIADSLLAHPEKAGHGASRCVLENIHTQHDEEIPLDPALSVFDNAEAYYKRSRKGKRGLSIVEEKISQTRGGESALVQILKELEQVRELPPEDAGVLETKVTALQEALREQGVLPKRKLQKDKTEAESVPFRHMTLDGWDIFIGKNDAQNDELTTRFAKPWDIWMHVAASAGSHMVIRREKNAPWPPRDLLIKAASLCVWFSKAKHTSYAEVHVTEARFVHKRRHAPAGEVIAERCKTLRVSPKSPQDFFSGDFDK
jgi:predicted ribosome quality control (RQC) complex YloA/Tae2 family protein